VPRACRVPVSSAVHHCNSRTGAVNPQQRALHKDLLSSRGCCSQVCVNAQGRRPSHHTNAQPPGHQRLRPQACTNPRSSQRPINRGRYRHCRVCSKWRMLSLSFIISCGWSEKRLRPARLCKKLYILAVQGAPASASAWDLRAVALPRSCDFIATSRSARLPLRSLPLPSLPLRSLVLCG
jgi:hypothetical protein